MRELAFRYEGVDRVTRMSHRLMDAGVVRVFFSGSLVTLVRASDDGDGNGSLVAFPT